MQRMPSFRLATGFRPSTIVRVAASWSCRRTPDQPTAEAGAGVLVSLDAMVARVGISRARFDGYFDRLRHLGVDAYAVASDPNGAVDIHMISPGNVVVAV